jgi:hypothetical protein
MDRLTLAELAQGADVVVVGTVTSAHSAWSGGRLHTWCALTVDDAANRRVGESELVIRHLGGAVGDYVMLVPGTPAFAPGDRVLVFARAEGNGVYHTVGLAQGVFRVSVRDGVRYAQQDLAGIAFAGERGGAGLFRLDVLVAAVELARPEASR